MANAIKTNTILSAIAGAAFTASSLLAPSIASAEDINKTPAVDNFTTAATTLSPELQELHEAALAARNYSENNFGIGILIHVGAKSFPNKHFESAEQFGQTMVAVFEQKFGVPAQYFLNQNDTPATGITYHIGDVIHGADNGSEVKGVNDAFKAMNEVSQYLKAYHGKDLAQAPQAEKLEIASGS